MEKTSKIQYTSFLFDNYFIQPLFIRWPMQVSNERITKMTHVNRICPWLLLLQCSSSYILPALSLLPLSSYRSFQVYPSAALLLSGRHPNATMQSLDLSPRSICPIQFQRRLLISFQDGMEAECCGLMRLLARGAMMIQQSILAGLYIVSEHCTTSYGSTVQHKCSELTFIANIWIFRACNVNSIFVLG